MHRVNQVNYASLEDALVKRNALREPTVHILAYADEVTERGSQEDQSSQYFEGE